MIGRTIDTRCYGQTVFKARKARQCREMDGLFMRQKDELNGRQKCMRLRKVDMYEVMMDKAMDQWNLTWIIDEALKEKCGKQIMTTKHFSVATNVTTFVINSFKLQ